VAGAAPPVKRASCLYSNDPTSQSFKASRGSGIASSAGGVVRLASQQARGSWLRALKCRSG